MQRRRFVARMGQLTVGAVVVLATDHSFASDEFSIQSFAYYQGLGPNEKRSPRRLDGTAYDMPCIRAEDIDAGEQKTYDFWHGHGRKHRFTVSVEHFALLQQGEEVELYTDVVDGHRHALRIKPGERCQAG